ncbi:leucine rich repeat [Seminavis robusta]|uniref:Leucine rich repeat n=1 Tax=Seminavis robusta TaxID=568900 RepID=A0A9N8HHZ8_9STRA|nr:leucine rich repeat [Seminavis robusta]|eukprot:Sro593_g172270.1 leucine rich repeat (364) ;mRNA; r:20006-21097
MGRATTEDTVRRGMDSVEATTKARENRNSGNDPLYAGDVEHSPTSVPIPEDLPQRNYMFEDGGLQKMEYMYIAIMVLAVVTISVTLALVFGLQTGEDTIIYLPRHSAVPSFVPTASPLFTRGPTSWRQHQLFALVTIYYALGGPNWLHGVGESWLDESKSECEWFSSLHGDFKEDGSYIERFDDVGSVCNDEGKYQTLDLRDIFDTSSPLDGLPNETALLTSLKSIFLEGAGGFTEPFQFMFITPLLHLAGSLEAMSLKNSMVHGYIPSLIGRLTMLRVLDLSHNKLGQAIRSEIGLLTNLKHLKLGNNSFVGQLPTELGLLTALETLDISSNLLTGQIPTEISTLQSKHSLEVFLTDSNQFV